MLCYVIFSASTKSSRYMYINFDVFITLVLLTFLFCSDILEKERKFIRLFFCSCFIWLTVDRFEEIKPSERHAGEQYTT